MDRALHQCGWVNVNANQVVIATAVAVVLGACTAKTVSPPLSAQAPGSAEPVRSFDHVLLTSGRFKQPHRVIGVIQMTQSGYKWFHELEVIEDADPRSLLFKIGSYARAHGAEGVQHLIVRDLNPQSPAEKVGNQIDSAVRIHQSARHDPLAIAGEGTETRWEIRGELIKFEPKEAP
jgi:hypothetical protein